MSAVGIEYAHSHTGQTDRQTHDLYAIHSHLVLKISKFGTKISDLCSESRRLLLGVNGVYRAFRRTRTKLLHLQVSTKPPINLLGFESACSLLTSTATAVHY